MKAALELAAWFISLSVILCLDLDMKATLENITAALLEDRRWWFPQEESKAVNYSNEYPIIFTGTNILSLDIFFVIFVSRHGFVMTGELHNFTSGTTERFAVLRNVHLTAMKWIAI